jgi:hypothetical protein
LWTMARNPRQGIDSTTEGTSGACGARSSSRGIARGDPKAHRSAVAPGELDSGLLIRAAPVGTGVSSLGPHRAATGGVRADRVGAKLSSRAIGMRGAEAPGQLPRARPLAREISAGRASREALPSAGQGVDRKIGIMMVAAPAGDCWRGSAELRRFVVVLAGRIDCRSRQAARGPSRPWAKSPRNRRWV